MLDAGEDPLFVVDVRDLLALDDVLEDHQLESQEVCRGFVLTKQNSGKLACKYILF